VFVQDSLEGAVDLDHELFLSSCNAALSVPGP